MRVEEGASFTLSDGTWSRPTIELGEVDYERLVVDHELESFDIKLTAKYELLTAYAQYLLALRVLKAKMSDQEWFESEGKPMFVAAKEELQSAIDTVKGDG